MLLLKKKTCLWDYLFCNTCSSEMSGRREKDNLSSWIYLGITIFAVIPVFGVLFSIGILLTVWQEYYQETNVKAGKTSALSVPLIQTKCDCTAVSHERIPSSKAQRNIG